MHAKMYAELIKALPCCLNSNVINSLFFDASAISCDLFLSNLPIEYRIYDDYRSELYTYNISVRRRRKKHLTFNAYTSYEMYYYA